MSNMPITNLPKLQQSNWAQTMPSIEEIAAQFPQLEIRRMVGRGGMGAIYQARQTTLDRDVALKIITKEVSSDPLFVERFEREARALAKLSHPNIVTVYDFGRTASGMAYLIMEFVDGVNLREAIATKSVGAEDALGLIATMCHALDYAHSKGVVHRDIKPENILLGEDGSLKIADFGIAKIIDDSQNPPTLTATRQVLGSLHYLAPEQIESPEQVDHRVDLYALGVVFYELLTGQLPLGNFEPPSSVLPKLDKRIDAIVLKTLSRKPALRYQNASQLKSDIDQVSSGNLAFAVAGNDSQRGLIASVPFHIETFGGLGKIVGSVQATPNSLKIEYRKSDNIFGSIKTQLYTIQVPVEQLTDISVKRGVFNSTLVVTTGSASSFDDLPESESGRVQLKINRPDHDLAEKVVATLGFAQTTGTRTTIEHWNPTQAILLAICSMLNAGFLAAIQATLARMEGGPPEGLVIISAVSLSAIIMLQLVGSALHITSVSYFPYRAAMIVSLLPITPVALLTIPLAIWYFIEARTTTSAVSGGDNTKSWGETTMIYIRENRAARWFSIMNGVGLAALLIASVVYFAGLYPTTLRYRIVGEVDAAVSPQELLSRRLIDYSDLQMMPRSEDRLDIKLWAKDRHHVLENLAIEKSPEFILIVSKDHTMTDANRYVTLDLAPGLKLDNAMVISSPIATTMTCLTSRVAIKSDMLKSIQTASNSGKDRTRRVAMELTIKGRKALAELIGNQADLAAVGLLIGDTIQALAPISETSSQQLEFALGLSYRINEDSISAAIRGPQLPFDLELLK